MTESSAIGSSLERHPQAGVAEKAPLKDGKKRTRVQFSCTACRYRKLKCQRTHPCENCKKRGEAMSCTYVGRGPRIRSLNNLSNPSHMQDRLQHLENLVKSLAQKKKLEEGHKMDVPGNEPFPSTNLENDSHASDPHLGEKCPPLDPPGKLVVKDEGTSYIDGAHWRAILEEISEMKQRIQETDETSEDETFETDPLESSYPALLFGLYKTATKEKLLADLPPRPIADQLMSSFIEKYEPSTAIIHIPTFLKKYYQFWAKPKDASLSWLGLLYATMTLAVTFHHRAQKPLPGTLGNTLAVFDLYRKRTAQCLALSNYTVPGRYKVETLALYAWGELFRNADASVGVSFILGTAIRLAVRMGYHRDPKHYPSIPVMEGEMRRRLWTLLCQMDTLISFQVGLPRTIQGWQYDTELPRNLMDEDFDENTVQLPPSRPETERTHLSYTIAKSRIMSVFGRISDLAYSREPVTYGKTLEIDRNLEEAHDMLPPFFKMRPLEESIGDSVELITLRYSLEILYQKARCVLHRRFLADAGSDPRYGYSRWVCISAAKEILQQQADLYYETQPGCRLYGEIHVENSLRNSDYLLAAMIICLELSYNRQGGGKPTKDVAVAVEGREDLLSALEKSHEIFKKSRRQSADAQKACEALAVMLGRVKAGQHGPPGGGPSNDQTVSLLDTQTPLQLSAASQPYYVNGACSEMQNLMNPTEPVSSVPLGVIEDMLDTPDNIDWRLWDLQMHGLNTINPNNLVFPEPTPPGFEMIHYPSDPQNGNLGPF